MRNVKSRAREADQVRAFAASGFQCRIRRGEGDDVHNDIIAQRDGTFSMSDVTIFVLKL